MLPLTWAFARTQLTPVVRRSPPFTAGWFSRRFSRSQPAWLGTRGGTRVTVNRCRLGGRGAPGVRSGHLRPQNTAWAGVCGSLAVMIRTLHLEAWAGLWVAVDDEDRVVASASTVKDLMATLDGEGIEDVEIMRAPDPNEAIPYGLG